MQELYPFYVLLQFNLVFGHEVLGFPLGKSLFHKFVEPCHDDELFDVGVKKWVIVGQNQEQCKYCVKDDIVRIEKKDS